MAANGQDSSGAVGLRLIAAFKLAKTVLLIATGVLALSLRHRDVTQVAHHLLSTLRIDAGNHFVLRAWPHLAQVNDHRLLLVGIGSFVYAAMFATEGTGLWLRKRWAEWLTIVITTSFIPLEIMELVHRTTVLRVGVLAINVAALGYLVARRVHAASQHRKVYGATRG